MNIHPSSNTTTNLDIKSTCLFLLALFVFFTKGLIYKVGSIHRTISGLFYLWYGVPESLYE